MKDNDDEDDLPKPGEHDEARTVVTDHLSQLWSSLYDKLLAEGFKKPEAMMILTTYIISTGTAPITFYGSK